MENNVSDIDESVIRLKVTENDCKDFKRLDHFLAAKLPHFSRSFLKNLFDDDQIHSDDETKKIELKKMPVVNTIIVIDVPPPIPSEATAENLPLEILFEDEYLVIINKPAGMVTHPAPGNYTGTLVNAILYHCPTLLGVGNVKRPGIVHRLDKGTSGVMVVAKEQKTHEKLVNLFSKHDLTRLYETLVCPLPIKKMGMIESTIGRSPSNRLKMAANVKHGKKAITHFKVIKDYQHISHIECKLETGRTHQIRVHLSQILNAPILNDFTYANVTQQKAKLNSTINDLIKNYEYPFLHAKVLKFVHPMTNKILDFQTPPPAIFEQVKKELELS